MDISLEATERATATAAGRRASESKRRGPRPLALHIARAEWAWRSRDPSKLTNFYRGIKAYRDHSYRRTEIPLPIVWKCGESRLYDYGPEDGWPIFVIPSLINQAYILDLMPGMSLLHELQASGFRPFLFDWGRQTSESRRWSLEALMLKRMEPAFEWLQGITDRPPFVLGYCMGGTLATALACRCSGDIAGLALLAAPWDFSGQEMTAKGSSEQYQMLAATAGGAGSMSVDFLQMLFSQLDPLSVPRKFSQFATSDPTSAKATLFVAIEDWLNDGKPLGAEVAAACFLDWYGSNAPARGMWRINGDAVRPERLDLPVCLAVPENDHIVPPRSALALASIMGGCHVIRPGAGHVSMVVGQQAKHVLWEPLVAWLREIAALQKKPLVKRAK